MAITKVRDCISRARASVSRKVHHFVLFHLVDSSDGLAPQRLQEWDNSEERVADQVETYAAEHAAEYRIAQQYKLGAYEDGAADTQPMASVPFKMGAGTELNGETHPANERGFVRQNMAHTEFAIRYGFDQAHRSSATIERVLNVALERETRESERWRKEAESARTELAQLKKDTLAERESMARTELEAVNTKHLVASRQRLIDEALKVFPVITTGLTGYLTSKLAAKKAAALPQGQAVQTQSATAAIEGAPAAEQQKPSNDGTSARDVKILGAIERLCERLGDNRDEVVQIRLAVSAGTWALLEEIFYAISGEST